MGESAPFLAIFFALTVLLGAAPFVGSIGDYLGAHIDVGSTTAKLVATQEKAVSLGDKLLTAQTELAATRDSLLATRAELTSAKDGLRSASAELAAAKGELQATEAELSSVKQALARATAQVRYRDPTYGEVIQFLKEDLTNYEKYNIDAYNCRDYSADVIRNAEARGIRAAYVSIRLRQGSHAVVGFDTVDKGLLFFEPQTDKEVVLPVGESYLGANAYKPKPGQDDTITRVTVIR